MYDMVTMVTIVTVTSIVFICVPCHIFSEQNLPYLSIQVINGLKDASTSQTGRFIVSNMMTSYKEEPPPGLSVFWLSAVPPPGI